MSTETDTKVVAEVRENFGKGYARRLRAAGKIPAVIYGHGTDPVHITLPGHETLLALRTANALLSIEVDGGAAQLALPKQVQRHPVRHTIEHVDLLIVRRGERVNLYQLGDSDTYYWESAGLDLNLRRLETVTKMWSGNPKNDNRQPSESTHYMFTVSTHDKHITINTSQANGEPVGWTIQLNTGKGYFVVEDTDGRVVVMDRKDDQIMAKNMTGTFVDLKGDTLFGNAVHGDFKFSDFNVRGVGTFHDHITMKKGLKVTGGIESDSVKNSGHIQTKSINPNSHGH